MKASGTVLGLRKETGLDWVRRKWPLCGIDTLGFDRPWCERALWTCEIFRVKVVTILLWSDLDKTLSAVWASSALKRHRSTDVHLEIAWAEESDPRAFLLGSVVRFAHWLDYESGCVYTEEEVEEGDENS